MELSEEDLKRISPMMKEYCKIKKEYEGTMLFYRVGDFFELFFDDAIKGSRELGITLTDKFCGLDRKAPMAGMPYHSVDIYINKLINLGYKVAVCDQVEDPKDAKGLVKREVTEVVSPGTYTNASLINPGDYNFIASISKTNYSYAFSYADMLIGKVYTTFIVLENDKLINEIVNLNIKEIVVKDNFDPELEYILKEKYHIYISHFNIIDDVSYKDKLTSIKDEKLINNTNLLLSYLTNNLKKKLDNIQNVQYIDLSKRLILDKEAIRNLELVETLRSKEKTYSLLWFLDKCKTAMGSRLLKTFILSPSIDKEEIESRQNLIEKFNTEYMKAGDLRDSLYHIYDLERLTGRVSCAKASPRDLIQLKNSLNVIPDINNTLKDLSLEEIDDFKSLVELLESSINDDVSINLKDGDIIKENYNKELDLLKSIRKDGKDFLNKFETEERERTGIKNLKIGFNKVFGYYIEISKGSVKNIPEEFNYERKQTTTNGERYISPLLKEKEDLILNAEDRIYKLEVSLFNDIKLKTKEYTEKLQKASDKIAYYDVISCLSFISERYKFVKPVISQDNTIRIINGRHPVVEEVIKDEYIQNDVVMEKEDNILIITGPNMSGKSTFMRELAIIVILNQIGCFVPAQSALLPIFDRIFTRIGASDDLVGGESTFMVEMKESANALKYATKNSLILFDELGRGTSTYDGMSLAGSIIEYISSNIKCKTLFSTHYHELTNMSETIEGIKNVHVSILEDEGEVKFLHKVLPGPVDKSYGINVAKLASLPEEVILRAKELLKEFENDTKKETKVKQYTLDLVTENKDILREYIKDINPLEITPLEALNILDEIKHISEK
ncbi:MAG: DNA mismatch repair protein MutS [Bacilli bacterium]